MDQPAYQENIVMGYINSLTGLRGMAAFIVFVSHCSNWQMLPAALGNGFGQIGVMLFFILSGFLMGHLYLNKDFTNQNIKGYLLARVGRIFPLYIGLILLSVLISTTIYPDFHYNITDPNIILRALLFIDAPFEFWTIPVEVQFYFVFIIFWFLHNRNTSLLLLCAFVGLSIVPGIILFLKSGFVPAVFSSYSLPFFVGIVTAINYSRISQSRFWRATAAYCAIPGLIALFLNLPAIRAETGWVIADNFYLRTWADPVNWLVVYSIFFCAMLNVKSLNFLNTRPFVFLGEISFGFYLLHYPILKIIYSMNLPQSLQFLMTFVVVTLLAWLSYTCFEKPVNQIIRKKFSGRAKGVAIRRLAPEWQ
jgi:peptidoglycan/LPS O-acetylase OafA/YrhL